MRTSVALIAAASILALAAVVTAQDSGRDTLTGRRLRLVDGAGRVRVAIDVADDGTVFVSGLDAPAKVAISGGDQGLLNDAADRVERFEDPVGMGTERYRAFLVAAKWNNHNAISLGLLLQQAEGIQRLKSLNPEGAKKTKAAAAEIARLLRAGDGPGAAKALDGLRDAISGK